MFEKATRLKLRFETVKGLISVEDLWDMPLTSRNQFDLDSVAKGLSKKLKESEEESFVAPVKELSSNLELVKFVIVKNIIAVKLKELEQRESEVLRKEKKDRILNLIRDKREEEFSKKSISELEEDLKDL